MTKVADCTTGAVSGPALRLPIAVHGAGADGAALAAHSSTVCRSSTEARGCGSANAPTTGSTNSR